MATPLRYMRIVLLCWVALALSGCARGIRMPNTPYVMRGVAGLEQYESVRLEQRTPEIRVLYFTDRLDERKAKGDQPAYGNRRAGRMLYGTVTVTPNPTPSWDEFVAASTTGKRKHNYRLLPTNVREEGTIEPVESLMRVVDGRMGYPKEAWDQFFADLARFDQAVDARLEPGNDNGVLLYVHGFHNTFDDAALQLAQVWHAAGRDGVPILFSWPAGNRAFLPIAYNHDRESGEFSIQHLKILLYALARNPRIARIHLVAHSRGTDVVITTLRELGAGMSTIYGKSAFSRLALDMQPDEQIPLPSQPKSMPETTKIKTLVLAAADIDRDVFIQRYLIEQVSTTVGRTLIYSSRSDFALSAANFLLGSERRLGQSVAEDFPARVRDVLGQMTQIEFIECQVKSDNSHGYLFENPASLSDMIRAVRDGATAGSSQRPLAPRAPGFWYLDDDYLRPGANADDMPAKLPFPSKQ